MKIPFLLILAGSLVTAHSQSTNAAPAATPALRPGSFTTDVSKKVQPEAIIPLQPKPNEISLGKTKVSGIAVEIAKTKQPLKVINPFSPPTNSSPEDNVVRDPFNGKVNGLKVFAFHF